MDIWNECLDSFLCGVMVGLGMSIVVAVCTLKIDLYYLGKENIAYQQELDAEFEKQRREAEGWLVE